MLLLHPDFRTVWEGCDIEEQIQDLQRTRSRALLLATATDTLIHLDPPPFEIALDEQSDIALWVDVLPRYRAYAAVALQRVGLVDQTGPRLRLTPNNVSTAHANPNSSNIGK